MASERDWESQLAASLPKLELHLHLDGSLSAGKWPEFWVWFLEHKLIRKQIMSWAITSWKTQTNHCEGEGVPEFEFQCCPVTLCHWASMPQRPWASIHKAILTKRLIAIMSLRHCDISLLCHCATIPLCNYTTRTLCQWASMPPLNFDTMSQHRYVTARLCHSAAMSQRHYVPLSYHATTLRFEPLPFSHGQSTIKTGQMLFNLVSWKNLMTS